jgi:D-alanine-D-alanine ligase-like ATP-grasp enzyme
MQRNNLLSAKKYNTITVAVTISFATEKDRVNGVATLIRSPYAFKGIDKNKFILEKEHLKIFKDTDIKYNIL